MRLYPFRPVWWRPAAAVEPRITGRDDALIGVDDEARWRVEGARKRIVRHEPGPVPFAGPAGGGQPAVAGAAYRNPPRRQEADISLDIGIGDADMRRMEILQRGREPGPVPRPVQLQKGRGRSCRRRAAAWRRMRRHSPAFGDIAHRGRRNRAQGRRPPGHGAFPGRPVPRVPAPSRQWFRSAPRRGAIRRARRNGPDRLR